MANNMSEDDNNSKSQVDFKWWQKLFFNQKCEQIRQCEEIIEQYESLKRQVLNLRDSLFESSSSLKKIYNLASSGISYFEFQGSIGNINTYASEINSYVSTLDSVINDIEREIRNKSDEISTLKSQIQLGG